MPVMQFEPLENIYERGYYDEKTEPSPPLNGNTPSDERTPISELESQEAINNCVDTPEDQENKQVEYCALHGCKISASDTIITSDNMDGMHTTEITFPTAIAVCKPSNTSRLNVFNPLEESEPNLDLYMSNQNKGVEESINDIDSTMKKVITRKCVVRVRNLKQEEIEFMCGPKLLPSFRTESNILEAETPLSAEKIAPTETLVESVASTSEHGTVCNPANDLKDGVPQEPD